MHRRTFLTSTLAGVGAAAVATDAAAQGGVAPARPNGDIPAAAVAAGQGPAPVAPEKLRRIGIMSLDHSSILKLPWDPAPTPAKTLAVLDLPKYYVDNYGVTNIEFQNSHLAPSTGDPDPAFFREMKGRLDAAGAHANQINLEIGAITQLSTPELRAAWVARAKKWVDAAPIIGATRLLLNQTGLNDANKADAIAAWKEIQDYAKPKGGALRTESRSGSCELRRDACRGLDQRHLHAGDRALPVHSPEGCTACRGGSSLSHGRGLDPFRRRNAGGYTHATGGERPIPCCRPSHGQWGAEPGRGDLRVRTVQDPCRQSDTWRVRRSALR